MLPPGEKFTSNLVLLPTIDSMEANLELLARKKCICLYGFIKYRYVFRGEHETRFCFVFEQPAGAGVITDIEGNRLNPDRFRVAGPRAYNRTT